MRKTLLLLSFIVLACTGFAQDSLTVRYSPMYKEEADFNSVKPFYKLVNTDMTDAEIYHPLVKKYRIYQDLGNIGSPAAGFIFSGQGGMADFRLGNAPMEQYYFTWKNTRYYQSRKPYTDIQYVQGSKELLFLKVLHTQNIKPGWNMGVDFRRVSSLGFYTNQRSSVWSTQLFSSYRSKNQRYQLLNSLNWNKGYIEMNGGIQSDSIFESLSSVNKQLSVNLQGASSTGGGGPRSSFRNTSFHSKQFWYFGKSETIYRDKDTLHNFISGAHISHSLEAERFSFLYNDKNLFNKEFYPNFYFDTTQTYDSLHYFTLGNTVSFNSGESDPIYVIAGLRHQYIEVAQKWMNNIYQNVYVEGGVYTGDSLFRNISLQLPVSMCMSGYNQGDYSFMPAAAIRLNHFSFEAHVGFSAREPDFLTQRFVSNHYIWYNNFDKTTQLNAGVSLSSKKWRHNMLIRLNHYAIDKLVYYGASSLPAQLNGSVQVTVAELGKTFRLGNFVISSQLFLQSTDAKAYIRVPEFSAFERVYYEKRLFKKALLAQLGFDLSYYSSLYANGFNAVTRQFQLQDSVRIGNYPVVDAFLNMEIKRAILFFKMEHVNAGMSGKRYYSTAHYPMPHRAFRFGIRWRMFD